MQSYLRNISTDLQKCFIPGLSIHCDRARQLSGISRPCGKDVQKRGLSCQTWAEWNLFHRGLIEFLISYGYFCPFCTVQPNVFHTSAPSTSQHNLTSFLKMICDSDPGGFETFQTWMSVHWHCWACCFCMFKDYLRPNGFMRGWDTSTGVQSHALFFSGIIEVVSKAVLKI